MRLEDRYISIFKKTIAEDDLTEKNLRRSRELFQLKKGMIEPRRFNVYTCLAGLPINKDLQDNLSKSFDELIKIAGNVRHYKVIPTSYHWELFIIKRPNEKLTSSQINESISLIKKHIKNESPFSISYKGLLVTPDGTILAKGYGEFDHIRNLLKNNVNPASLKQSELGHISLGRILDPIGCLNFEKTKKHIINNWDKKYGLLNIQEIKVIYESQWYMKEFDPIAVIPLKTNT